MIRRGKLAASLDPEMKSFPRTYNVVRGGSGVNVTVETAEALLQLRTELELVRQFGQGCTIDDVGALDERLRTFSDASGPDLARRESLADMRSILADSFDRANKDAVEAIDRDFPEMREALDMASIKKETDAFQKDLEQQLSEQSPPTSESPPVDATTDAAGASVDQSSADQADALAEADSLLNELVPQEAQTPEDATASLVTAQDDLTDIATSLESAAEELDELDQIVRMAEPAPDEVTPKPLTAAPSSEDAEFEAMAAELDAEMNDRKEPSEESMEPGGVDLSAAIAASASSASTTSLGDDYATAPAGFDVADLRRQLADIKAALVIQFDRLGELVEQSAGMQDSAQRTLAQASRFRAAAKDAQNASQRFTAAQAAADEARAAYEHAQQQVAQARQEWETAQQLAAQAADQIAPTGS